MLLCTVKAGRPAKPDSTFAAPGRGKQNAVDSVEVESPDYAGKSRGLSCARITVDDHKILIRGHELGKLPEEAVLAGSRVKTQILEEAGI